MSKFQTNKLYTLDVFEYLNLVPENKIDLAIIDPPYNLNKDDWDTFKSENDFFSFTFAWIDALIPKIKNGGSIYIFNTPYNSAFILNHLVQKKLFFQNWLTWDKRDGFNASRKKFCTNQESILFFTKGKNHTFNSEAVRVPYESTARIAHAAKKGILKNGKRWFPNPDGKLCGDVWHMSSERHKNKVNGKVVKLGHQTPKPLEMIERIILASSNENDIVLDCFIGTGTTAVAAKKLQRNFTGNDSSVKYIKISNERINKLNK